MVGDADDPKPLSLKEALEKAQVGQQVDQNVIAGVARLCTADAFAVEKLLYRPLGCQGLGEQARMRSLVRACVMLTYRTGQRRPFSDSELKEQLEQVLGRVISTPTWTSIRDLAISKGVLKRDYKQGEKKGAQNIATDFAVNILFAEQEIELLIVKRRAELLARCGVTRDQIDLKLVAETIGERLLDLSILSRTDFIAALMEYEAMRSKQTLHGPNTIRSED